MSVTRGDFLRMTSVGSTSAIVVSIGATAGVHYKEVRCPLVGGSIMGVVTQSQIPSMLLYVLSRV